MTMSAVVEFNITATEVLAATAGAVGVRSGLKVVHDQFNVQELPGDATTPPVTIDSEQTITGATSGTIDLTALPVVAGTISGSTKKLRAMRIHNRGATGNFVISTGGTTGYVIETRTVGPGETFMQYYKDRLTVVDSTHKFLDWTGTSASEVDVTLLVG